jgi:hypothetical protein
MSTDSTRQYDLPTPISNRTSTLLNKHSIQPAVPESQDLIYIKTDLDNILSSAQLRIKNLKKDSNHLEKNVKITNGTWYYYFE